MSILTLTESVLQDIFSYLIVIVEACGGLVLMMGVLRAVLGYVKSCVLNYCPEDITELRIRLGKSMVFALELQVAADILKTGLSPTWEDILRLAAIIALRTVLNYLLERELDLLDPDHALSRARQQGPVDPLQASKESSDIVG